MVPNLRTFIFCTKLNNKTNLRMEISNLRTIFSNSIRKIRKSGFFGPKFKDFYFSHETLQADSRELIANMAMVFQGCCPKHPNKAFLVHDFEILIFAWNFAIKQTRGRWLQIWQFFNIPPKDSKRVFLVPSLFFFVLDESL